MSAPRPTRPAQRSRGSMTRAVDRGEAERLEWVEYYKRKAAARSAEGVAQPVDSRDVARNL